MTLIQQSLIFPTAKVKMFSMIAKLSFFLLHPMQKIAGVRRKENGANQKDYQTKV